MTARTTSAPLSADITDRLLDLLSTDDLYRDRFQADPRAALVEIGYLPLPEAGMTACGALPEKLPEALIDCTVTNLAPKEAIAAARAEIRAMLTRGLNQQTPKLDTGLEAGAPRRRR